MYQVIAYRFDAPGETVKEADTLTMAEDIALIVEATYRQSLRATESESGAKIEIWKKGRRLTNKVVYGD